MNAKTRNGLFCAYFLSCFLANVWPIVLIANRIEPTVFGLPFFLCWTVAWSLMAFMGIVALYFSKPTRRN